MKIATNQERLNELFDADPRNDTAIAAELGVSKQTISAWRKGIRSPKKPMLLKLAEIYHVDLGWLMGYDVSRDGSISGEDDRALDELLDLLVKLTPKNRELAKKIIINLIEEE